jgi:putative CocE/NonD family hydrolase
MDSPTRWFWRTANQWPVPDAERVLYFLAAGPSGSIRSVNDGRLTTDRSQLEEEPGRDQWIVDYSTTTGISNRWIRTNPATMSGDGGTRYGDRTPDDSKGLTYTTEPLAREVVVVGHPVVTLYATSTAPDGDFFVYLEEIDATGVSNYLTEGTLRASHRVLGDPPYKYGGLPLPDSRRATVEATPPLSAGVAELTFELYPTANIVEAGHRIRVTVLGNDQDNTATPVLDPAPTVTLYHTSRYPSRIELPVLRDEGWRSTARVGGPQ